MYKKYWEEALRRSAQNVAKRFVRTKRQLTLEELEAERLRKREGVLAGRGQFERLLNSALLHGGFNG